MRSTKKHIIFFFTLALLAHNAHAQNTQGNIVMGLETPQLSWVYTGDIRNITSLELYRSVLNGNDFQKVATEVSSRIYNDSLWILAVDTTLTEKGLYKYYCQILKERSNSERTTILYGHNLGFIPPAEVRQFTTKTAEDQKAIILEWNVTHDPTLKNLNLYKSSNRDTGFVLVATFDPKINTYTDFVQRSNEAYFYFLEIINFFGDNTIGPVVHGICQYEIKPYPPVNAYVEIDEDIVELRWERSGIDNIGYHIYRRGEGEQTFRLIHQLMDTANELWYQDPSPMVGQNEYYIKSISDGYLESKPSDILYYYKKAALKELLPAFGYALLNNDNQITLNWESLEKETTVLGYRIVKMDGLKEKELGSIMAHLNFFTDTLADFHEEQHYKIYTLQEGGEYRLKALQIDYLPTLASNFVSIKAERIDNHILLSWKNIPSHFHAINIYKMEGQQDAIKIASLPLDSDNYIDSSVHQAESVLYIFSGIDKNGKELLINEGIGVH